MKRTSSNTGVFFILLAIGVVIAIPLRFSQLSSIIDPTTGFYTSSSFSVVIIYVIAALMVVAGIVVSAIQRKALERTEIDCNNPLLGIVSIVFSAALIIDAVMKIRMFIDGYNAYNPSVYSFTTEQQTLTTYLLKSGYLARGFEAVFAVLSSVYFVIFGLSEFGTGKIKVENRRLLALCPLIWGVCRIIYRFMRTISYIKVSELFYELLMIVFLMMFFMAFAQIKSKVNAKGLKWKLYGYGIPAIFFSLLCFVPRLALIVVGKANLITVDSPIEYCDFAAALFIFVFLLAISKGRKSAE